jgi:hypothetical protein
MQSRADVDLGGTGPTLAANDRHAVVALDARGAGLVVDAHHLHAGAQCRLRPRQSLHMRFHAPGCGRVILPQVTDAQPPPGARVNLHFAFCILQFAFGNFCWESIAKSRLPTSKLTTQLSSSGRPTFMLTARTPCPWVTAPPIVKLSAGFAHSPTLINFGTAHIFLDRRPLGRAILKFVGFIEVPPEKTISSSDAICQERRAV